MCSRAGPRRAISGSYRPPVIGGLCACGEVVRRAGIGTLRALRDGDPRRAVLSARPSPSTRRRDPGPFAFEQELPNENKLRQGPVPDILYQNSHGEDCG